MSALRWIITLEYTTQEQANMALSMFRATAPDNFDLRIKGGKRTIWHERGVVTFRPEPQR